MNQKTFINTMDDFHDKHEKLRAVKLIYDTKIKGGLKKSLEFIDKFWYNDFLSIGKKMYDSFDTSERVILKRYNPR